VFGVYTEIKGDFSEKKVGKMSFASFRMTVKKTPLLDRRGAETNERSEFGEVGWWN
jgi:hypothetical protein